MGNYEWGGSSFNTEAGAVRALATSILVGDESALTSERVREVLEAHGGSLESVLSEWVRAGEEPTITVDRERFRPSDTSILTQLAIVAGEALDGEKVVIGSINVGVNFGVSGAIWDSRGQLVETTDEVFPRGSHARASEAAAALAKKRWFRIIGRSNATAARREGDDRLGRGST